MESKNVAPVELNALGLSINDYKGRPSTLCPGCGHNMVSNAVQAAMFEMGILPEKVIKMSGIGCSSKSTNYFLQRSFGFNSLHGRMPNLSTGASFGDTSVKVLGISGDGDSASIGMGHFKHVIRRNVPMVYIIENNGVYGLTKGQFSATTDLGLQLKHQGTNVLPPLDLCLEAILSGASFVARAFAGDPKQMKEIFKAALAHDGLAVIDVISPCVTFNNKQESYQSYFYGRENLEPLQDIKVYLQDQREQMEDFKDGETREVELPDGSVIMLKKTDSDHDPTNRMAAFQLLVKSYNERLFVTGLVYIKRGTKTVHEHYNLVDEPLNRLSPDRLRPTAAMLESVNAGMG
jgi:2-oxoglutarate ferredoxin oxidoreductase subunit beta